MKYQNILWDWNGTLLNDIDICIDIANRLLDDHESDRMHKEHYKSIFGFPVIDYYKKAGFDFARESFDALSVKFIASYNNAVTNCELHHKAQDTLQEFQHLGAQQFILTAAFRDTVLDLLNHFAIDHFFHDVAGLDNIKAESKIAKGVKMMEKHRLVPRHTLMVGDTLHDFEVAREMGVACILIADGHQSEERLKSGIGEENVLTELAELKHWIKG